MGSVGNHWVCNEAAPLRLDWLVPAGGRSAAHSGKGGAVLTLTDDTDLEH